MGIYKTWVVIVSSESMTTEDLSNRLKGLEWWVSDRYKSSEPVKAKAVKAKAKRKGFQFLYD